MKFPASKAEVARGNAKFCDRSCSAVHRNRERPRRGSTKPQTYAERKAAYGGQFMLGQIVGRIRGRARKKGVPCDLTNDLFRELWAKQKGQCYYTGRSMTLGVSTRYVFDMDQVSVDRIRPEKGYVEGNVVLCCRWVNSAKGQGSLKNLKVRARELLS